MSMGNIYIGDYDNTQHLGKVGIHCQHFNHIINLSAVICEARLRHWIWRKESLEWGCQWSWFLHVHWRWLDLMRHQRWSIGETLEIPISCPDPLLRYAMKVTISPIWLVNRDVWGIKNYWMKEVGYIINFTFPEKFIIATGNCRM